MHFSFTEYILGESQMKKKIVASAIHNLVKTKSPLPSLSRAVILALAGTGVSMFLSGGAYAQDLSASAQESTDKLEVLTVTGSRIQNANLISSSPVTQVNAEDFKISGITRVEDLLNDLPQVYAGQASGVANGASGIATANLRNLGSNRTLVLIDGRRMGSGSPTSGSGSASDLNQIPGALVERVEVLTGGASAAYGSDAIAGVVNFIMQDDFEGLRIEMQGSQYQHDNDNKSIQSVVEARDFDVAKGSATDGKTYDFSVIAGANFDRGNVTAYASYRSVDAVLQANRDYSSCALGGSSDNFSCGGSSTTPEGRFTDFGSLVDFNGTADPDDDIDLGPNFSVVGDQFVPYTGAYNFGPLNYYQRPDERISLGAFAHMNVNDNVEVYMQLSVMDDRTVAQIAPSGNFFVTDDLSCGNAFLSDQQFQVLCANYGLTADDNFSDYSFTQIDPFEESDTFGQEITQNGVLYIGRRNVEGGPRRDDLRHTSIRGLFGARGSLNETWVYDVYAQFSEVSMEETYFNDLGSTRIGRSLDAVVDPESGEIVCQAALDGLDTNCVPWNIFGTGPVTEEALDYLRLPLYQRGTTSQDVISGYIAGNLGDYGIKFPFTESGPDVVLGLESRRDTLDLNVDDGFKNGEGAGQGGPQLPVSGSLSVDEFYTEVNLPIAAGKAFAEELVVDLAYRYSDYSTDKTTNTYKIGTQWSPVNSFKIRASYQEAIRHANIQELFRSQTIGLFDLSSDPCGPDEDGNAATASLEECLLTGLSAGNYNSAGLRSPASQYNEVSGGNPDLDPEESTTTSVGFLFTPTSVDGLKITLDYFDIDVSKAISAITSETVLNECLTTGNPVFCDSINRGPNGNLWVGDANVTSLDINIGFFRTTGYDLAASYEFNIGDKGSLQFDYNATLLTSWQQQEIPGGDTLECAGKYGGSCGSPTAEYRGNFKTTWRSPWDVNVSGIWRHIGGFEDISSSNQTDLPSINYLDLSASWNYSEQTTFRAGINNVLDKEPPLTANAGAGIFGNGNTFPGTYDALGRYMFVSASFNF